MQLDEKIDMIMKNVLNFIIEWFMKNGNNLYLYSIKNNNLTYTIVLFVTQTTEHFGGLDGKVMPGTV